MKFKRNLFCAAAFLLAASAMQAATVNVNLGTSAQNFFMTGLGALGNGDGSYNIRQGTCSSSATLTTCTLSGTITGADNANYASGTYSFITTYAVTDVMPVQGESQTPTSNFFFYRFLAPDVNMSLVLNGTPIGNVTQPLVTNGAFVAGTNFGFAYTSNTCTGVATCTQANVGQVNGATITGPVTIGVSFTIPNAATPEPTSLALTGISGLLAAAGWLRRKRA